MIRRCAASRNAVSSEARIDGSTTSARVVERSRRADTDSGRAADRRWAVCDMPFSSTTASPPSSSPRSGRWRCARSSHRRRLRRGAGRRGGAGTGCCHRPTVAAAEADPRSRRGGVAVDVETTGQCPPGVVGVESSAGRPRPRPDQRRRAVAPTPAPGCRCRRRAAPWCRWWSHGGGRPGNDPAWSCRRTLPRCMHRCKCHAVTALQSSEPVAYRRQAGRERQGRRELDSRIFSSNGVRTRS